MRIQRKAILALVLASQLLTSQAHSDPLLTHDPRLGPRPLSWTYLPENFSLGILHFFQLSTLIGYGGGALLTFGATKIDSSTDASVTNFSQNLGLENVGVLWRHFPTVIFVATLATNGLGYLTHLGFLKDTSMVVIEALVLDTIVTSAIKGAFARIRPNGGMNSFSSGHTSTSFAFASSVSRYIYGRYDKTAGVITGIGLYGLASLVAISRITEKAHYFSDCVFGAVSGTLIGLNYANFHLQRGTSVSIMPAIMPDGGYGVNAVAIY